MSVNIKPQFLKTENASIYFDIHIDILKNGKRDNTFKLDIHYVQPRKKLLRWNIKELEKWFYNKSTDSVSEISMIDNILK
ncbi:MAG: hypothetical protein DRG78_03350 [Epsilonproteobacteria bacterium]|nr:MAG: hypothetical protein DRG78_03350 [Campylobacterota bacterium]